MKTALRISVGLNLALLSGLVLVLTQQRKEITVPARASVASENERPVVQAPPGAPLTPPESEIASPRSFRWSELVGTNGYRLFVANLRTSGCPEATIEDIVWGDTDRAFRWERNKLGLNGSGNGPWSEWQENQLIASLLGEPSEHSATAVAAVQNTENSAHGNNGSASSETASSESAWSKTPLFLQDVNWSGLGFDASEQAAIARVRQQYQSAANLQNQNSSSASDQNSSAASSQTSNGTGNQYSMSVGQNAGNSAAGQQSQTALQNADDQLRNSLGAQGYAAYEQQQYYMWYQPQMMGSGGGPVTLNLSAFSSR